MRYLIALIFPGLTFFTMGKIFQGILCIVLQITLIGWLPATIWALVSVSNYNAEQRNDKLIGEMNKTIETLRMK